MSLSFLSEDISSVSEVTAAIESIQKHNMAQLINTLERKHVQVDFSELSLKTQQIVQEMIAKKHWSSGALRAIITDIPENS